MRISAVSGRCASTCHNVVTQYKGRRMHGYHYWMRCKHYLLPFLLGVSATLTLPPFYIFPLVIPAYGGLFQLLNRADSRKQATLIAFFWGWGFFMSGLYWFTIALLTDPDKFGWLIPFALFALTAVIALYTAVFGTLYFSFRREGLKGAVIFAALWTLVEVARGHFFTGFPWNLGGYVFAASDASIQLASLVGIYGLTMGAVLVGAVSTLPLRTALCGWVLVAFAVSWGEWRVQQAPREMVDGVMLRLVQANIQQHHKWNPERQTEGLTAQVELSREPGSERVTHFIWPETAVPYLMQDYSTLATRLGYTLLPSQKLLTGTLRGNGDRVTNSMVAINQYGNIISQYDKHKLVPFGEFLPLRWLIPSALETPVGMHDLAPGEGTRTLRVHGLPPVSPLICYEVIFPGLAVDKSDRPAWLLSITNDAWFGTSTAPYQHLAMARMRAVEQGLPMVRVANTGITAVFDGYGREYGRIPLNKKGFLDIGLPRLSPYGTVYARWF